MTHARRAEDHDDGRPVTLCGIVMTRDFVGTAEPDCTICQLRLAGADQATAIQAATTSVVIEE